MIVSIPPFVHPSLPVVAISLLLTACGEGGGSPATSEQTAGPPVMESPDTLESLQVGVVHVLEYKSGKRLLIDAAFQSGGSGAGSHPMATGDDELGEPCVVRRDMAPEDAERPSIDSRSSSAVWIDAGERIRATLPGGERIDALPSQLGETRIYSVIRAFPFAGALGPLVLEIPGAEFPAMDAVTLPAVPRLEIEQPIWPTALTPESSVRWKVTEGDNDFQVRLIATHADIPTVQTTTVTCVLPDTGRFEFPISIRANLGDRFASRHYRLVREFRTRLENGDATLLISRITED